MDLRCYERDQGFVLARFREGEFDYIDATNELVDTEFFRHLGAEQILRELAATYPAPRQNEAVPLWISLASNLSLRLHFPLSSPRWQSIRADGSPNPDFRG